MAWATASLCKNLMAHVIPAWSDSVPQGTERLTFSASINVGWGRGQGGPWQSGLLGLLWSSSSVETLRCVQAHDPAALILFPKDQTRGRILCLKNAAVFQQSGWRQFCGLDLLWCHSLPFVSSLTPFRFCHKSLTWISQKEDFRVTVWLQ